METKRRYRTADQSWVRQRNLAILMNYLWSAGGVIARSQLTEISGLNKTTVGNLLELLESWNFIREVGYSESQNGRPSILVEINPDGGRIIGVEIGVGFVSIVKTNMQGTPVCSKVIRTNSQGLSLKKLSPELVLNEAERVIREVIEKDARDGEHLLGIGVGVPGLVDSKTGTLLFAPNLHWVDLPIKKRFSEQFNTHVIVENEANAAALGEWMLGCVRQEENFIYLSAGVGLGGGCFINGHLYRGAEGFAGEVGHVTLDPNGPFCNCGNRGCWETFIGPNSIIQQVQQIIIKNQDADLLLHCGGDIDNLNIEGIIKAAENGIPVIQEVFKDVGRYLGIGISNLTNAFNPKYVVLGGVLSLAGPYILPTALEEIDKRAFPHAKKRVEVKVSAFKFDACVRGSATLILSKLINNPWGWKPESIVDNQRKSQHFVENLI